VSDLEEERAVAECEAALDAFCAADAEFLVDIVLEVRLFDVSSRYRSGGAKLVLGAGIEFCCPGFVKSWAIIAVSAQFINLNAFDG